MCSQRSAAEAAPLGVVLVGLRCCQAPRSPQLSLVYVLLVQRAVAESLGNERTDRATRGKWTDVFPGRSRGLLCLVSKNGILEDCVGGFWLAYACGRRRSPAPRAGTGLITRREPGMCFNKQWHRMGGIALD